MIENETATPVPPWVDDDRGEPECAQAVRDGGAPRRAPGNPFGVHFDAGGFATMAHTQVAGDPHAPQQRLPVLDLAQPARRDGNPVLHATRQTGRRGCVPVREAERLRDRAYVGLGETRLGEWRADSGTLPCTEAGAVLGE